ncbi:MAG: aminomethyltransferase beta-barrel domain-containing protein, partial [Stellaceae bacterium]
RTTRDQLDFLRFPLGKFSKDETRAMAARFDLPVAQKPDSQDICFVPSGHYAEVIEKLRPGAAEPGEIVDEAGRVLGRHDGVIHFTVGQRKGIGVAGEEPLYVLRLEPASRRVVVGPRASLGATRVPFDRINWLAAPLDAAGIRAAVKLRSAQPPMAARLRLEGDCGTAVLDEPAFGVAPGQACVVYDGDRVLGGGWIARA